MPASSTSSGRANMNEKRYVIEGFESLTPQQCFDMAAKHVLSTGKQCQIGVACSYRGIGCAASVFLTEEGKQELVGSWAHIVKGYNLPEENVMLIHDIQECHDNWADGHGELFLEFFERKMREVAMDHNLSTAVFDNKET